MSCCGRRARAPVTEGIAGERVVYRYIGTRVLVLRGPATGREYRFGAGMALSVNWRDATAFSGIPGLRREQPGSVAP